jgi:hypothetical protein
MQELNPAEAQEFLNEFIYHVFLAAKTREERKIKKEVEESKLIEREFPKLNISKHTIFTPIQQREAVEPVKIGIEKIDTLLADPAIDLIECSDGNIRIRKKRNMQETGFRMDEKEIIDLVNKISAKTGVPLKDNFFQASIGNIKINAIISELIGSRFLIVKRS